MIMRQVYAAVILSSLAAGVSAQSASSQSTASGAGQDRIQLAQAGSGPNSPAKAAANVRTARPQPLLRPAKVWLAALPAALSAGRIKI